MDTIYRLEIPVPFAVETVNVFLIKGDSLTLVDTGTNTAEARLALQAGLGELGYRLSDIETVIITHHHVDHSGLLNDFSETAAIIGHPRNEPWISQNPDFLACYEKFFQDIVPQFGIPEAIAKYGPPMKRTLAYSSKRSLSASVQEGDRLDFLPEFTVIETPGHASTHIALFRERDGLMVGGDVLLGHISSNPLLEPPYFGESERKKPLLEYNSTLRRLSEMPISRILPGHGSDVTGISALIEERLKKQEARAQKILNLLKEKPMTAFEICVQLFPALYTKQLALTLSETVGQLDFLEYNQQVLLDTSAAEWMYYAK